MLWGAALVHAACHTVLMLVLVLVLVLQQGDFCTFHLHLVDPLLHQVLHQVEWQAALLPFLYNTCAWAITAEMQVDIKVYRLKHIT